MVYKNETKIFNSTLNTLTFGLILPEMTNNSSVQKTSLSAMPLKGLQTVRKHDRCRPVITIINIKCWKQEVSAAKSRQELEKLASFLYYYFLSLSSIHALFFIIIILLCRSGHTILWKCFATGKCRRSNCTRVLSRNSKRMGFDIRISNAEKGIFFYYYYVG